MVLGDRADDVGRVVAVAGRVVGIGFQLGIGLGEAVEVDALLVEETDATEPVVRPPSVSGTTVGVIGVRAVPAWL